LSNNLQKRVVRTYEGEEEEDGLMTSLRLISVSTGDAVKVNIMQNIRKDSYSTSMRPNKLIPTFGPIFTMNVQ